MGYCEHGVKFVSQVNNYHLHRKDMNNYEREEKKHVSETYSISVFN